MATIGAKAIRRSEAVSRLERVATALGEQFGVEVPKATRYKDSDLQQSADIEATAAFLESLSGAFVPHELIEVSDDTPNEFSSQAGEAAEPEPKPKRGQAP